MRVCERCSREQRVVLEPVRTNTLYHRSVGLQKCSFHSYWRTHNSLLRLAHLHSLPLALKGETARRLLCGFYQSNETSLTVRPSAPIRNAIFHNTAFTVFLLSFSVVKFDFKLSWKLQTTPTLFQHNSSS